MIRINRLMNGLGAGLVLAAVAGILAPAQAGVSSVYPDHDNYWTGRVMSSQQGYSKHNADMMYGKDPPDDKWQGYARFNLSEIPDDAVILSASFFYHVVSQSDPGPATDITAIGSDPLLVEPEQLWNDVVTGTVVSPELVTDRGWVERPLNPDGLGALKAALGQDWVALGIHKTADDEAKGHAKGYQADRFRPYILIAFAAADMGIDEIVEPTGDVNSGAVVTPSVAVTNHGEVEVPFDLVMVISDGTTELYRQTVAVGAVPVGGSAVVPLPDWTADAVGGERTVTAELLLADDANPDDNFAVAWFRVVTDDGGGDPGGGGEPEPHVWWGWLEGRSLPEMPAVRNVKAGGTLAVDPSTGVVYGTRGNRSPDFFAYNPLNSRWQQLASVPGDKAPGRGAGAAADGKGSVYLAKGSSTPEFWRYDIAGNRWERLPDMPLDPSGKRNRAGASLAAAHQYGLEYVYALRGVTGELLRYSTAARTWQTFGAADPGTTQRWQKGSWLSVGPDSRLYVLKGKYNQLRTFGLEAEAWDAVLPPMPLYSSSSSRARRAGAGSSGTWQDGALYALKGGRSAEFWKYEPETRNWVEQEPMPVLGSSMKRAKPAAGAGLVSYPFGRLLYALKGGNTREFWRYFMPPAGQRGGTMSNPVVAVREAADAFVARLSVSPSPVRGTRAQLQYSVPVAGRATVSLLDVSGRVVRREQGQLSGRGRLQLSLDGLGAGSYLVQLDGPGYSTRERVVVVR